MMNDMWNNRVVCKKCHYVMNDIEPMSRDGEYWHPISDKYGKPINCSNSGKCFHGGDKEIEPFERKRVRRNAKRLGKQLGTK